MSSPELAGVGMGLLFRSLVFKRDRQVCVLFSWKHLRCGTGPYWNLLREVRPGLVQGQAGKGSGWAWSGERNEVIFRVPSNPKQSVTLW